MWICLILLLLPVAFPVSKENFKTCKQSSFCDRQRSIKPGDYKYSLKPSSLQITSHGIKGILSENARNYSLSFELTHLLHSTFRVLIDEDASGRINLEKEYIRYQLPIGTSLKSDVKTSPIDVKVESKVVTLHAATGESAIVTLDPFEIVFYLHNEKLAIFNHNQLSNFDDSVRYPPVKTPEVKEEVSVDENPESTSSDESPDEAGDVPSSTESEVQKESEPEKDPSNNEPDPNVWHENFNSHLDTRPFGPTSISVDIDFPGFANIYGVPEHTDSLRLAETTNGDPYRLYNLDVYAYEMDSRMALYGSVPFTWAQSTNHSVGVFLHNPTETWLDVRYSEDAGSMLTNMFSRKTDYTHTRWMSEAGVVDFFVMLHSTPKALSAAYAELTGTTPLPPLFALAYHQCRWNYNDMDDILTVSEKFDENLLPVDVLWLDIEHTDGKRYFTWDKSKFPDPGKMVDTLNEKGRKLVTVVDPHIKDDKSWSIYSNALSKNYFVANRDNAPYDGWCWPGSSKWPDFLNPEVRKWWANLFTTYEPVRKDTMFSWNDMGEPSIFNGPEVTMLKDAKHFDGYEHRDVHNIYGALVHEATFDGQVARAPEERPFVLTRAFFAGSQRTAAVWTGDNEASWSHLKASIPMVNSLSISGIPFSGADVGGFLNNPDNELLTRWYQAGAFQPFFRAHAHLNTKRREPYLLPEENLNIVREALRARYALLPYWYTLFAFSEASGEPVMAPMWYHFPNDKQAFDIDSQHMLGDAILVAPVVDPGAVSVNVYFPKGVWYNHVTYEAITGDQWKHIPVQLNTIPVFYRGGSVIVKRERPRRSSWAMRFDEYTLVVLIDPLKTKSTGFIYTDDYHSTDRTSAVLYEVIYETTKTDDPEDAHLRLVRRPLPGQSSVRADQSPLVVQPEIERIVIVGHRSPIVRVNVLDRASQTRSPVRRVAKSQLPSGGGGYATVIGQPGVKLNDNWELHVVMSERSNADL